MSNVKNMSQIRKKPTKYICKFKFLNSTNEK